MCIAVPMRLVEVVGNLGTAESGGVKRQVQLDLLEEPTVGDYVLVHAGYAIQQLDEQEALETLALVRQVLEPPQTE